MRFVCSTLHLKVISAGTEREIAGNDLKDKNVEDPTEKADWLQLLCKRHSVLYQMSSLNFQEHRTLVLRL